VRKYLDVNDTISEIRLLRRHPGSNYFIIVLVEGDDDIKLFRKLINGSLVRIEQPSGGCGSLEIVLNEIGQETDKIIGIRDADFLNLLDGHNSRNDLFYTDYHDMEMTMINNDPTFYAITCEHCSESYDHYKTLRHSVLMALQFLSGIRLINHIDDIGLYLRSFPIGDHLNPSTLEFDKNGCVEKVHMRSKNKKREITVAEVDEICANNYDLYDFTCGHDFKKALAIHMKKLSGTQIGVDSIGCSLRTAFSLNEFKKTTLFCDLNMWENNSNNKLFQTADHL